jgi:hypothetical protein
MPITTLDRPEARWPAADAPTLKLDDEFDDADLEEEDDDYGVGEDDELDGLDPDEELDAPEE